MKVSMSANAARVNRNNRTTKLWFWYLSRPNEIFLDLDSGPAITRALSVLRRVLRARPGVTTPLNKLPVTSVWMYPTTRKNHAHIVVILNDARNYDVTNFVHRVAWSLWMGTDPIRAAYVLERHRWLRGREVYRFNGVTFGRQRRREAELLVSRRKYGFREPDAECNCQGKHQKKSVTDHCPAMKYLLGNRRSDDYFPRNRDRKKRQPVRFPWGQIPLKNLKEWKVI